MEFLLGILAVVIAFLFVKNKKNETKIKELNDKDIKGKLNVIEEKARAHSSKSLDDLIKQSNIRYGSGRSGVKSSDTGKKY